MRVNDSCSDCFAPAWAGTWGCICNKCRSTCTACSKLSSRIGPRRRRWIPEVAFASASRGRRIDSNSWLGLLWRPESSCAATRRFRLATLILANETASWQLLGHFGKSKQNAQLSPQHPSLSSVNAHHDSSSKIRTNTNVSITLWPSQVLIMNAG